MINNMWNEKYLLAKEYYELHGDLLIPKDYEIILDGKVIKLGAWINVQRQAYKNNKLTNDQINLLLDIHMVWNKYEYVWYFKYQLAKEYYELHGDLLIEENYVINNIKLGKWVKRQRTLYKENILSENQIKLLENIKMIWDCNDYQWNKYYLLAKDYYEQHGNLLISVNYEVKIDDKIIKLGLWITNQRKAYKGLGTGRLTNHQIKLLNDIGMVWKIKENFSRQTNENWFIMYDLAKEYYKEHGNLLMPKNYTVTIGDEKYNVDHWVKEQRRIFKNKNVNDSIDERVLLLNKINIIWDVCLHNKTMYSKKWYENYLIAKEYYENNGNLLIPSTYKVEHNGKIVNLGDWINTQRRAYRLKDNSKNNNYKDTHIISDEQIRLLEEIGMIWNVKDYNVMEKFINKEYIKYEKGLLDESEINKMLKEGYFSYNDDNKIVKGNSLVLTGNRKDK